MCYLDESRVEHYRLQLDKCETNPKFFLLNQPALFDGIGFARHVVDDELKKFVKVDFLVSVCVSFGDQLHHFLFRVMPHYRNHLEKMDTPI